MSEDHGLKTTSNSGLKSHKHKGNHQREKNGISDTNISPTKNESGRVQTIRKCIRKGSRVCYTDLENITVLRKIPEKDSSKASVEENRGEILEKIDSYRSGESLFKTFTFEQTRDIDDPETVKCIEFWKSVMKRNLAPIKCTLIESNRKSIEKKDKTSVSSEDKKSEHIKPKEKKDELNFTGDGARIWSEALKEIRKKKLDQLKLYVRERCQYCTDPFTKDLKEELGVQDMLEQQSEILSLNAWKPKEKQIDLMDSIYKPNFKKRFSSKLKMSTTQTIETRMNEKSASEQLNPNSPELPKRHASNVKIAARTQRFSSTPDISRKSTAAQVSTVEVQAPSVKCPCDSDTCICPHRTAARNSRTSFIEIARRNMLTQDASVEKLFPAFGAPCVCENFKQQPWLNLSCSCGTCPAKQQKMKMMESCSDFNLTRILENSEDICVCTKNMDVVCPSENCKNKISQGSLIEGFPQVKPAEDTCVCSTEPEAPCVSDVCPIKTHKEFSTTCICGNNLPWSQATCQSWNCRHHKIIKRKIVDDEEKIRFKGHRPIKKTTSKCMCQDDIPWSEIECDCELCTNRRTPSFILRKRRRSSTLKKLKSKSSSLVFRKKKGSKSESNQSLERLNKEKEKVKPKATAAPKPKGCVCSDAPPWKTIICQKCVTTENKANVKKTVSTDLLSLAKDDECVCKDINIESVCKEYQCKNKETSVDYPPPCLCPKDLEESKHEHFHCFSDTCKMKKIDKTCVCRTEPGAPCDAKSCISKPQAAKTLMQSKKPLRYDAKCICRVRGLPTTQEVTCVASQCPFQRKQPKVLKKKVPQLYVPPPNEHKNLPSEKIVSKCVCNGKDTSKSVTCHSLTCRKKNESLKSRQSNDISTDYHDEDDSEQEVCVCKDEKTDLDQEEVVCNHIQCPKMTVGEDGAVMNDKCVCANLDEPCDEPTCLSAGNAIHDKICSDLSPKKDRPYCYICGHYDCVGANRKTVDKKVCNEVFTDIDDL